LFELTAGRANRVLRVAGFPGAIKPARISFGLIILNRMLRIYQYESEKGTEARNKCVLTSFVICIIHEILLDDQMFEDEVG
jgi:hypothetical protein